MDRFAVVNLSVKRRSNIQRLNSTKVIQFNEQRLQYEH